MTSIYGNNTPIGAEMLLRNNDVASKDEATCKGKGWEWSEGQNSSVCLSPCPEGYTSAWDNAHGAICNIITDAQTTAGIAKEKEARQQVVANEQKKNTDVFVKDPPKQDSNSTILLDLGGGVRIDTQGVIAIIALIYVVFTRKSK
jgi:hypothetical protein